MKLDFASLDGNIMKVTLTGRMDIAGAQAIDMQFAGLASASGRALVIDMSGVEFLASIGMRTFLLNAKSLKQKGGTMVMFNAADSVAKALRTAGIDVLIPIHTDLQSACAACAAPARRRPGDPLRARLSVRSDHLA